MLISIYLSYEWSYDGYQRDAKNVYQIESEFKMPGSQFTMAGTPAPMAKTLLKDFPEVTAATRLMQLALFEDKTLLQNKGTGGAPLSFYEEKGFLVDSNFFQFFSYPFIEGDPASALQAPLSIVLSEDAAHKLFGSTLALGKIVHVSSGVNGDHDFRVTGVYKPNTGPSHIDARFFLTFRGGDMETFMKRQENDFTTNNMFDAYIRLHAGADPRTVDAKFPAFLDKYAGKDMKAYGIAKREFLVPLREIHLRTDVPKNVTPPASRTSLYILGSIAAFTLLIACINFMNLATARSAKRSSEVGIRKVMGAVRGSLIGQFLGESVLMSVMAFILALGLTTLLLPALASVTQRDLNFRLAEHIPLLLGFLGLAVFAGLIAGIYPAFYLSSFQPARVLKGKFSNSLSAIALRKGLVVFQFIISVVLIVSTVVINDQMNYLQNQDLGFEKTSQVVIPLRGSAAKGMVEALEAQFGQISQVMASGAGLYYPGLINPSDNFLYRDDQRAQEAHDTHMNYVDFGYMQTLGLKAVAGRIFSKEFPGDTAQRIILNESAVKALGYASPQAAVGAFVKTDFQGTTYRSQVVGVVRDFHYEDLHTLVTPYAFQLQGGGNYILVHARPGPAGPLIASLSKAWHKLDPDEPFEYSFLDEDFQKNYAAEERLSTLIRYFTVMAILISCLGLFGLASFSAEQRIREIGIRKVLGASISGIVMMLTKDFLILVGFAMVIAAPVAWLVMSKWLHSFAYQTPISWVVFLITFLVTLGITMVTVSFHAVRAGLANPIKSLKTE